jgi:putative FmdB family regulatory protein
MPIYEYRCPNGHEFEVFQSMAEDPVSRCRECGAPVERVFHPVAVHFKGSGFYATDYKSKSKARADSDSASGDSDAGKSDAGKSDAGKSDSQSSGGEKAKATSSD